MTMHGGHYLWFFFGGIFLTNAVPHIVNGVMGHPFPTLFSRPPGRGVSSPTVNVLWGFFNLGAGYLLVENAGDFDPRAIDQVVALALGALLMALILARMLGQFHSDNNHIKS